MGVAGQESDLRMQFGAGLVGQQLGAGTGAMQYQQALQQQRMAGLGGAAQMPMSMGQQAFQERMAGATTTTDEKDSALDWVAGIGAIGGQIGAAALGGGG
jgi:hypothetical protein